MCKEVKYQGSPYHKLNPLKYGFEPPKNPRSSATLCDSEGHISIKDAHSLLKTGVARGMVSEQIRGKWPQNIWAVGSNGRAFEAQLENKEIGSYHGYPMTENDEFRVHILKEWSKR